MRLTFSRTELRDLGKAWVVISVAFAIVFTGGFAGFFRFDETLKTFDKLLIAHACFQHI